MGFIKEAGLINSMAKRSNSISRPPLLSRGGSDLSGIPSPILSYLIGINDHVWSEGPTVNNSRHSSHFGKSKGLEAPF